MNKAKNIITEIIVIIFLPIILTACIKSSSKVKNEKTLMGKPTSVIGILFNENGSNIYDIKDGKVSGVQPFKNISDFQYSNENEVYAYINEQDLGENLNKNTLQIVKDGEEDSIKGYFSIKNMRLSKDGKNILYTPFKNDDLSSVEQVKIYSIDSKKEKTLSEDIYISGDLYFWLDNDNVVYYGVNPKTKEASIFKYNIKTGNEEIYVNNIEGYVVFMKSDSKGNIIYASNFEEESKWYYYDSSSKSTIDIPMDLVSNVINGDYNKDESKFYFIGEDSYLKTYQLYSLDINTKEVNKITYDFPTKIYQKSRVAIDGNKVYFNGLDENDVLDMYYYNEEDESVSIILYDEHSMLISNSN